MNDLDRWILNQVDDFSRGRGRGGGGFVYKN